MPFVPWDRLEYREPSKRRATRKPLPWRGLDTETCRGDVRLIADCEGHLLWDPTPQEKLAFLYDTTRRGVFWNLRYDIECILKDLPRQVLQNLFWDGEAEWVLNHHDAPDGATWKGDTWSFTYIPRKRFGLKPFTLNAAKPWSYHYDMAQFFNSALDKAGKEHFGEGKQGLSKDQVRRLGQDRAYWRSFPRERIEAYCVWDAALARRLAVFWEDQSSTLGFNMNDPISPAYVAGQYALAQGGWPTWAREIHESLGPIAWAAFSGGRFESRLKGIGKWHRADIRSAYPWAMEHLPSTDCAWTRTRKEADALRAPWGFVLASYKVDPSCEWGPLPLRSPGGTIYYPLGNLGDRWTTLEEWRTFRDSPGVSARFKMAWTGEDTGDRPLKWMAQKYLDRLAFKEAKDPRQAVLKVMINSVYGKMIQKTAVGKTRRPATLTDELEDIIWEDDGAWVYEAKRYRIGQLFNPIWAAHITAMVRLRIWDTLHRFDVGAIATDGILTRGRLPDSFFNLMPELGSWEPPTEGPKHEPRIQGLKPGVIVGNGLYQIEGEKPKRRGFGEPRAGFDWYKALRDAPRGATRIMVEHERPLHPGELLRSLEVEKNGVTYTVTDAGLFVNEPRWIDLNDEHKRRFPKVTAKSLLSKTFLGAPHVLP